MTRRHFELIARALADLRNESGHEMGDDDHLRNRLVFHIHLRTAASVDVV